MKIPLMDTTGPDYLDLASMHVSLNYDYIVHGTPDLRHVPPGAVFGTWCISVPGKVRYILDGAIELAPGVLPGDVARAWVRANYTLPIKRRRDQRRVYKLPVMARVGRHTEGVYLDIRHAYLDILQTAGYNIDYKFGKYMAAKPVILPNIVKDTKWVYAIIVAMSAGARSHMVIKSKENGLVARRTFNLFSNPCLYAVASEVLACLAAQVLSRFGKAIWYINTDGYICHPGVVASLTETVKAWGFEIREKARGETQIFGVGSWRCGDEKTLRRDDYANDFCSALPKNEETHWLQQRFTFWHKCATLV